MPRAERKGGAFSLQSDIIRGKTQLSVEITPTDWPFSAQTMRIPQAVILLCCSGPISRAIQCSSARCDDEENRRKSGYFIRSPKKN